MTCLDDLRDHLRRSRTAMLAAVHGLPEELLQQPGAVGHWSVAQVMAQRIEAENRALTLVQSMLHGHPLHPALARTELDRLAAARRRGWAWANLMADLYQQREETAINLASLDEYALHLPVQVGEEVLTPAEVLAALAHDEAVLAHQLAAWRRSLEEEKRS